ncbi:MAG TPA: DUF5985 family protein [Ramlibacter sp.]|nr:DUF5985 family protein [Ramlibacter sp.]
MNDLLMGAIAAGNLVAGLFFFRFWRSTHDRFFLYFALSFTIEAANRVALALTVSSELEPVFYLVRVVAYGLIVLAILQKNRGR